RRIELGLAREDVADRQHEGADAECEVEPLGDGALQDVAYHAHGERGGADGEALSGPIGHRSHPAATPVRPPKRRSRPPKSPKAAARSASSKSGQSRSRKSSSA